MCNVIFKMFFFKRPPLSLQNVSYSFCKNISANALYGIVYKKYSVNKTDYRLNMCSDVYYGQVFAEKIGVFIWGKGIFSGHEESRKESLPFGV